MHDPHEFIREIRAYFDVPDRAHGDRVTIINTGIAADGVPVIIYTEYAGGPLVGMHVDLEKFAPLFGPGVTSAQLGEIVASNEIADPGGPGTHLDVDWADGLVPNPSEIGWRGSKG
jgi:hypothetical protein